MRRNPKIVGTVAAQAVAGNPSEVSETPGVHELEDAGGVTLRYRVPDGRPTTPTPRDRWLREVYGEQRGEYFTWDPSLTIGEMLERWRAYGAKGYDDISDSLQLPTGEYFQAIYSWRDLWPYRRDDRPISRPLIEGLQKYGWLSPILLRIGRNGCVEIGEGNHRIRGAKELDLQYVPVRLWFVQDAPCVSDRERRERARWYEQAGESESREAAVPEHIGFYEERPMKFNPGRSGGVEPAFDEAFDEIERVFPDIGTIELHEDEAAGEDSGAGPERQFAYCKDGNPIIIAFAPKAENLPDSHLRGLMRHEFGHALEYRYGVKALEKRLGRRLPEKSERRADAIAEAVWGEPIEYDEDYVQCVGAGGTSPRPKHLPDKKEKLKANAGQRLKQLMRRYEHASVSEIVQYIDVNSRSHLNLAKVRRAVADGGDWYFLTPRMVLSRLNVTGSVSPSGDEDMTKPIVVGRGGEVLDGRHRVARAQAEGVTALPAWVPAALLLACDEKATPDGFEEER